MDKTLFMRACREGGAAIESALRELDRRFFAVLYRDGLRALRDPDSAHDLVQDTFIKVWRRCATFRGDSELLPWIKSILRHAAIERLRQPKHEDPMEDHQGMTADASQHIHGDAALALQQAQRAVRSMRSATGVSYADPYYWAGFLVSGSRP